MIDINLLEYLVTFHKEGSLLKASESLNLSQPSLSKAMQKLEDELDLKIFDRKANKITLNQNGLELLDYANDILKMNEQLEKKAKELKENEMTMSIGYTAPGPTYKYPNLFLSNIYFPSYGYFSNIFLAIFDNFFCSFVNGTPLKMPLSPHLIFPF